MIATPTRRKALLASGSLVLLVAACSTATTTPTPAVVSTAAADAQLLANGLAALGPLLPASADAVLLQVQAAAAKVAADAAAIAAAPTPSPSTASDIATVVEDIAPAVIGLFPGGGTAVTIAQAAISLLPELLSFFGIASTRFGAVAPTMTPAMARGVLAALPRG